MERPFKYEIVCKKTKEVKETNLEPTLRDLQTWEPTNDPKVFELVKTKECYIDTRYEAKKRLFEYLHPEQKQSRYNPYFGTEIGKSIPTLNF